MVALRLGPLQTVVDTRDRGSARRGETRKLWRRECRPGGCVTAQPAFCCAGASRRLRIPFTDAGHCRATPNAAADSSRVWQ